MSTVTLFGFPRSTFVKVVGLILTAKGVPYTFHDTEDEMYLPIHLQRHPFGRVPALQHDDFVLYETSAIAAYVDDVLPGPKFTPADPRQRARMNQWMCNLNSYFYPEMIYHVSHERMVYPELGIPGNDLIVQCATPEGKQLLPKFRAIQACDNRMDTLPSVIRFNASLPPRAPIPHAREWVHHHRPAA